MNAAKRLKKMLDSGEHNDQLDVLKDLVISLHRQQAFDLSRLYGIDYPFFKIAMQLLEDWRLGHHMDTRSKLMERLFGMYPELMMPNEAELAASQQAQDAAADGPAVATPPGAF